MKRTLKIFGAIAVVLLVFVGWAVAKTVYSVRLFNNLAVAAGTKDFSAARTLVQDDALTITDSAIIYRDTSDVTDDLAVARPLFWKTLDYYLTDPSRYHRGKVCVDSPWIRNPDGSAHRLLGHATIDDRKFSYFKFLVPSDPTNSTLH